MTNLGEPRIRAICKWPFLLYIAVLGYDVLVCPVFPFLAIFYLVWLSLGKAWMLCKIVYNISACEVLTLNLCHFVQSPTCMVINTGSDANEGAIDSLLEPWIEANTRKAS